MRRSNARPLTGFLGTEPDYPEPEYSSLFRRLFDDFYKEKISSEKRDEVAE